jgi:hypothetical protein
MKTISPISVITNNAIASKVWFLVAVFLAAWLFVQPYLVVQAMKQKERAVILDGTGNVIYAPILGFEEASQLQAYHVRLACLALLQRNPNGLDFPELLEKLFLESARNQARKVLQADQQDFLQRQVHQKVEIGQINVLDTKTLDGFEAYLCEAKGQIIQTGRINDLAFVEPSPFTLRLLFLRNKDLLSNAKLPLAVQQFELKKGDGPSLVPNP